MPIKLIVTDLDNTLLRRDKTISDYTVSVFERLQEREVLLAFATARPKRAVYQYIDILDKLIFDAMIFHNGAVVSCGDDTVNFGIAPEITGKLACEFNRLGLSVGIEIEDRNYANYDPAAEWQGMQYVLTDFSNLPEKSADKIIIRKPSASDIARIQEIIPNGLYLEINEGILGLIMSRKATKQHAIIFLTEKYKILLSDVVAFGDDLNDIEMLRECGVGVAVANALDEVKSVADCVCGDCDNDGVARWIEENML